MCGSRVYRAGQQKCLATVQIRNRGWVLVPVLLLVVAAQTDEQVVTVTQSQQERDSQGNQLEALNTTGLAVAVANQSVDRVVIIGTVTIGGARFENALDEANANGTLFRSRNLAISARSKENTVDMLDFGNVPGVITIVSNVNLTFQNLTLKGVASRLEPGLSDRIDYVNLALGLWPSVVLYPDATIIYIDCQIFYVSNVCFRTAQSIAERFNSMFGPGASFVDSAGRAVLVGDYLVAYRVLNFDAETPPDMTRAGVYYQRFTGSNVYACTLDPLSVNVDNLTNAAWQTDIMQVIFSNNPNLPTSDGGVPIGAWVWAIPVGLILLAAISPGLPLLKRWQRRRFNRRLKDLWRKHRAEAINNRPSGSVTGSVLTSAERTLQGPRFEPAEGLVMGPLVGRGGYGRVYKCKWRGALVAVKIVELDRKAAVSYSKTEGAITEEMKACTTARHPNVVQTYKIWVQSAGSGGSSAPAGSSASGAVISNPQWIPAAGPATGPVTSAPRPSGSQSSNTDNTNSSGGARTGAQQGVDTSSASASAATLSDEQPSATDGGTPNAALSPVNTVFAAAAAQRRPLHIQPTISERSGTEHGSEVGGSKNNSQGDGQSGEIPRHLPALTRYDTDQVGTGGSDTGLSDPVSQQGKSSLAAGSSQEGLLPIATIGNVPPTPLNAVTIVPAVSSHEPQAEGQPAPFPNTGAGTSAGVVGGRRLGGPEGTDGEPAGPSGGGNAIQPAPPIRSGGDHFHFPSASSDYSGTSAEPPAAPPSAFAAASEQMSNVDTISTHSRTSARPNSPVPPPVSTWGRGVPHPAERIARVSSLPNPMTRLDSLPELAELQPSAADGSSDLMHRTASLDMSITTSSQSRHPKVYAMVEATSFNLPSVSASLRASMSYGSSSLRGSQVLGPTASMGTTGSAGVGALRARQEVRRSAESKRDSSSREQETPAESMQAAFERAEAEQVFSDIKHSRDTANSGPTASASTQDASPHLETWLVMEFADRGNLYSALKKYLLHDGSTGAVLMGPFLLTMIDVAAGMDYLHSVSILHGDLKAANVLLTSSRVDSRGFTAKISDFGMSKLMDARSSHLLTKTHGTVMYADPQLLQDGRLTKASDVYSWGLLMWESYTRRQAFADIPLGQLFYNVVVLNHRPVIPDDCPASLANLIRQCWDPDASKRPSFSDILQQLQQLKADYKVEQKQKRQRELTISQATSLSNAADA